MLRIAVCDDDLQELVRISNLLGRYRDEKKISLKYDAFANALELLEAMRNTSYDILLLDVLMPGMTGMEAAREIRQFDQELKIIFLTNSPEFAVESYAVDAYYYLVKPGTAERLFPVVDRVLLEIQRTEEALFLKTSSGMVRIPFHRLEYLEIISRKLYFHLTDGSIKELSGALADYEAKLLGRQEFIKVHRSYIVNMACIQQLGAKELLTYSNKTVPISRLVAAQVKESYMQHLFLEKGIQ